MIAPNRPGLSEIAYRAGTHATFKRALLAALAAASRPALGGLTTREDDDFTIALLDAWAVVSDVLTFYQERLANESYLRTATELESVTDILALIGYDLHPGVAAEARLAFSLQAAGAVAPTDTVTLDAGSQVKSLPGPKQLPQTFETSLALAAVPQFNALPLVTRQRQLLPKDHTPTEIVLSGPAARLKKGDVLVVVAPAGTFYAEVVRAGVDASAGLTTVTLANVKTLGAKKSAAAVVAEPVPVTVPVQEVLARAARSGSGSADTIRTVLREILGEPQAGVVETRVYALRTPAHLFGFNAADYRSMPDPIKKSYGDGGLTADDWPFHYPAPSQISLNTGAGFTTTAASAGGQTATAPLIDVQSPLKSGLERLRAAVNFKPAATPSTAPPGGPPPPPELPKDDVDAGTPDEGAELDALRKARAGKPMGPTPLDRTYPVAPGDWVAIKWPDGEIFFSTVAGAKNGSFNAFGLSGATTLLTFDETGYSYPADGVDEVRGALVYLQSEVLTFAATVSLPSDALRKPIVVTDGAIDLDGQFAIPVGRSVILAGTTLDAATGIRNVARSGTVTKSELVAGVLPMPTTRVTIEPDTPGGALPSLESAKLYANVVVATHGESVAEVLGSGDATAANQTFTLSHAPLTYVHDPHAPGRVASTLAVEVNGIPWQEVPSFIQVGPRDHVYVTRSGPGGSTTLRFGDGTHGSRLPTGYENVRAFYRYGTGAAGNVDPGQLALAITRPLSLQAVTNPIAASGGVAPEDRAGAQRNGPAYARTAERIVTLHDFADFARGSGGVVDARAEIVHGPPRDTIVLTLSAAEVSQAGDGTPDAVQTLLRAESSTSLTIRAAWCTPVAVQIAAALAVDAPFRLAGPAQKKLLADVTSAVTSAFAPSNRTIGAPLYRSEVIAVIQSVPGVVAVSSLKSRTPPDVKAPPADDMPETIPASPATVDAKGHATGASVIVVDAPTLQIAVSV
jgi:hypothetical protein